jgi:hypothetical protein
MHAQDRKAAIAAYKERKSVAGIYAVKCTVSGRVWVGSSPSLNSVQNRVWFMLNLGTNANQALQTAWSAQKGEGFTFEKLEEIEEDQLYVRDKLMKEREAHWRAKLGASAI